MDHRVILADCLGPEGLATLADKSVDHVITDPPYSEHIHANQRRLTKGAKGHVVRESPLSFAHLDAPTMEACAYEINRVCKRWALVFCCIEDAPRWLFALENHGMRSIRTGLWVKHSAQPQLSGDRPGQGYEAIAVSHSQDRTRWNGGGKHGIWVCAPAGKDWVRHHETEKPLALMEALVRDFTDPGELICDPFAGSGTTGVAAKRLGRRFIGWERDPKYHAIAQKRIDGTREQLDLLRPREPEARQAALDYGGGAALHAKTKGAAPGLESASLLDGAGGGK